MFDAVFTAAQSVTDYRGTLNVDKAASRRFNAALRRNGIFKSDNKMYVALAHDQRDVEASIAAFGLAAAAVVAEPH